MATDRLPLHAWLEAVPHPARCQKGRSDFRGPNAERKKSLTFRKY